MITRAELEACSRSWGAVAFGVTELAGVHTEDFLLPSALLQRLPRAIVLAMPLSREVLATLTDSPNRLYEHHYRQLNFALDRLALKLSLLIQRNGRRSLPIPASQLVDWTNQRGHISHKRLAVAAGIGWLGRNNLLVTPEHGAAVRLVSILTDLELEAGSILESDCGDCRACIPVCPAGAIRDSAEKFDHQACFALIREFQRRHLVNQYICGLCVRACSGRANANT